MTNHKEATNTGDKTYPNLNRAQGTEGVVGNILPTLGAFTTCNDKTHNKPHPFVINPTIIIQNKPSDKSQIFISPSNKSQGNNKNSDYTNPNKNKAS